MGKKVRYADMSKWDTTFKDKPVILIDEKNQAGIGNKGRSSKTFVMVATTAHDPLELVKIYNKYDPGYDEEGNKSELKFKYASHKKRMDLLTDLMDVDASFVSEVIDKTQPNIPKKYSPKNGRDLYRHMAEDILTESMKSSKDKEFNIYFDEHSSLSETAIKGIAKSAALSTKKRYADVRKLHSMNEPLLQVNDFPTGSIGAYYEDGIEDYRDNILPKLKETVIGGCNG